MHIYEKKLVITRIFGFFCSLLPLIFWCLVIFSFEEPAAASLSLLSAIIHEFGHLGFLFLHKKGSHSFRGVLSGMRIATENFSSYSDRIMTYLSGPLANFIVFFISSLLAIRYGNFFAMLAVLNLATAISNLLPIEGYDGYGIICSLIERYELPSWALRTLSTVSTSLIFFFCLLSLYMIDRQGGGYWIFAVFFVSMIKHFKKSLDK